jgi:hypothetical protein
METIRYSRALFLPGPIAPSTHLGITLQRHVVVSGLRYVLYHLGFPLPERPPIKIVQLRLYLDAEALGEHLGDHAGAAEVVGALCDPRGSLATDEQTGEVAAAAVFHRLRLATVRRRRPRLLAETVDGESAWTIFRTGVTRWLDLLNDAFLTEMLTSRSRRRRRGEDKPVEATLPREAWRFRSGRGCRLDCLGPADLFASSWSLDHACRELARDRTVEEPVARRDNSRGLFREAYREMLSQLRVAYLALADTAHERGVLDHPDDAFFIPFDLASDLSGPQRPQWLEEAVESNRREHQSYLETAPPTDMLDSANPVVSRLEKREEQAWNCLLPIL